MTTTTTNLTPAAQTTLDRLNTPSRLKGNGLETLDQGDFLRLLTIQVQQQDPFDPVDNKEMLAQMAQFSALSETNDVSQGVTAVNATLKELGAKLDAILTAQQAAAATSTATTPTTTA